MNLATILERELEEAFEVKNRRSLHRYVLLLSDNLVKQDRYERDLGDLKSDVHVIAETMKQGFANMNRRFEDMSLRFEDMNKRFEDMSKSSSFTYMNVILGILVLITVFFKFV